MIKSKSELEELKVLIESNFRILDRKISKSDRDMERILKKILKSNQIPEYEPIFKQETIKIRSYLDS